MKSIKIAKYFAIGLLTLSATTSCSDYLDKEPDTELDMKTVFTNRDKVYRMLSYVYNIIHTPDKFALTEDGYEVFADDLTPSRLREQWSWDQTIPKLLGQWMINSWWLVNLWGDMLKYIRHGYIMENRFHAFSDQDHTHADVDIIKQ